MIDVEYDFDFQVKQLSKFLWVLKQDPCHVDTVGIYEDVLKTEWAMVQQYLAGQPVHDFDGNVIDRDVSEEFLETIDEIKTYVAQCVIFD